jgi:hypothetical protein
VADEPEQALLTTLTTEHFTLQGARSQTVSETMGRSALYLGAVSSALIALGFVAQASGDSDLFRVFTLIVLPTLYALGIFTFVRLVELSVEDVFYGRAINRIRHYYIERAGEHAGYFALSGNDDAIGVLRNMGITVTRWQLYFTASSAIAVVNSVVGGTAVGFAVGVAFDPPLGASVGTGAVVALVSFALHMRIDRARHDLGVPLDPLFPSPAGPSRPGD